MPGREGSPIHVRVTQLISTHSTHSIRRRLLAVAAAVPVLAAGVVLPALPSAAAEPYTATGSLLAASPGSPATDLEFIATCPEMPSLQGTDAYVFALPADLAVTGAPVAVKASPAGYNLSAFVYNADCTYDRLESPTPATDLAFALAEDDRFVSVYTTTLPSPVTLTLTLGDDDGGTNPDPAVWGPAGPMARSSYPLTPSDPLFAEPGVLQNGQWGMRKIRAPQAWQEGSTGAGTFVAVIDSGLDLGHPDFNCPGKVSVVPNSDPDPEPNPDADPYVDPQPYPYDDEEGHGTHVAGIIGACTNNGVGVSGVAPDSTLIPIQSLSSHTPVANNIAQLAGAIDTAVANGAHVINMSLGFGATGHVGTAAWLTSGTYLPIEQAIDRAIAAGTVVVAASGNDTSPLCGFPAIHYGVICVGSTDPRDVNSWYGNFPVKPDDEELVGPALVAPGGTGVAGFVDCSLGGLAGEEILSTYTRALDAEFDCDGNLGYAWMQGTSMAAPHVAGVAALVYDRIGGQRSGANGQKVLEALLNSAVDIYTPGYDPQSGYGRLDALNAVKYWPAANVSVQQPSITALATNTQYSDETTATARLTDAAGVPVAGKSLRFTVTGTTDEATAVTGADGVATVKLPAFITPGSGEVVVTYAGEAGRYLPASGSATFTVSREDAAATLVPAGVGPKRRLVATLAEGDGPARVLSGRTVSFYLGNALLGSSVTDSKGTAILVVPEGSTGPTKKYEVRFAGDTFYLPATATTP